MALLLMHCRLHLSPSLLVKHACIHCNVRMDNVRAAWTCLTCGRFMMPAHGSSVVSLTWALVTFTYS